MFRAFIKELERNANCDRLIQCFVFHTMIKYAKKAVILVVYASLWKFKSLLTDLTVLKIIKPNL